MPIRIAFMGFRHDHILDLYGYARAGDGQDYTVVAACEEDPATKQRIFERRTYEITHDNYEKMLEQVDCDAVAVCDYFGKRGQIVLDALRRGKHVMCDKPICTSLDEFRKIRSLAAEKGLVVSCMLDIRDKGSYKRVRELVRNGAIGEVHSIAVGGQHPLLLGVRPSWYFEEGMHGGTINDISIHAFDSIRWITGLEFTEITAARSWNAFAKDFPHFHDSGQFMAKMENGCGVIGDVSYSMPDSLGRKIDQYWRITFFGTKGIVETSWNREGATLAQNGKTAVDVFPPCEPTPGGYMKSFIREIKGTAGELSPSSDDVLRASWISLVAQQAAYENRAHVKV